MKIKNVEFIKSVTSSSELSFTPWKPKPEICFVWRSNVWKSSILNAIFNSKTLVKTSSKPGHTKHANLFLLNKKYYFVDLPWYWFAKVSEDQREKIDKIITDYIAHIWENIKKVVIILDAKIWATKYDIDMFYFLNELQIPVVVVLNKIDKLKQAEILKAVKQAQETFFGQTIITYSAKTEKNHKELLNAIFHLVD